jgi:hypothetical protein
MINHAVMELTQKSDSRPKEKKLRSQSSKSN